ncbi:MAG: DUF3784 domain-containing protein [Tidjanibacter sp.]|nr:DUF3784 domain-containing protein [Tidjanibacter sp.]
MQIEAELYVIIPIVLILVALGILILIGKGDWAISGYNTASPEEKAQYNIRRLRLLTGLTLLVVAVIMVLDAILNLKWLIIATVLPICLLVLILGNTWAKN